MSDSPPSELPRGRVGRLKALQEKMKAQQKAQQLKEEQNKLEITTATLISDPATQLASKVSKRDKVKIKKTIYFLFVSVGAGQQNLHRHYYTLFGTVLNEGV